MERIKIDLSRYQQPRSKATSERAELIEKFLSRLNPPRIADGFKPLTPARLGAMLAHVPTEDLWPFYRSCEQANSFSRFFHWSLRPRDKSETKHIRKFG